MSGRVSFVWAALIDCGQPQPQIRNTQINKLCIPMWQANVHWHPLSIGGQHEHQNRHAAHTHTHKKRIRSSSPAHTFDVCAAKFHHDMRAHGQPPAASQQPAATSPAASASDFEVWNNSIESTESTETDKKHRILLIDDRNICRNGRRKMRRQLLN